MNKAVLIVTPFFAPQSHAAVFRAYKLAKHLPSFGWTPSVLTVDVNYLYNEDPGLLTALPPEVAIHRARYIEPTVRGLRMALGGADRTFAGLKRCQTHAARPVGLEAERSEPSRRASAYQYALSRWAGNPDTHWTWYGPALRTARRLVREQRIPLVYTTCVPYTCHRLGRALQHEGCCWVADFRDAASYSARTTSRHDAVFLRQRRIEREAIRKADAVTVLSSAYALIFHDMYSRDIRDEIQFIPTGIDEDLLGTVPPPRRPDPYLVFAGEFLKEYGDSFLAVFAAALEQPGVRERGVKLLVVGNLTINMRLIQPLARRLEIEGDLEYVDHLPQGELYHVLQGALAGVLIPGHQSCWWANFAKMVDYIGLAVPVLAMVPDPSEARTSLTRAGLGALLDGTTADCAATLVRFLRGEIRLPPPNRAECARYTARHQVASFAALFDSLIDGPHSAGSAGRAQRAARTAHGEIT